jgi:hypothetical protein
MGKRSSGRPFLKERRQAPNASCGAFLISGFLYQNLTEIPFGVTFTKSHFSWDYGGTDALSRNSRRQERSSPRGGRRSNPGRVDQEDLQDGSKEPDPFPQDLQFDSI